MTPAPCVPVKPVRPKRVLSELECFRWLDQKGLISDDEYFSPTKAHFHHYSLRRGHALAGRPPPPTGFL